MDGNVKYTAMTLEAYVSQVFGVRESDLFTPTRIRPVNYARQVCMYIRHTLAGHTQADAGRYFGRDHATVIHAVKTTKDLVDTDKNYRALVSDIIDAWYTGSVNIPDLDGYVPADGLCDEERVMIAIHG
jgi:chromosomal replication initiation ATPase DnaA